MADEGGGGDSPGHVPWSFVAQKKSEMMERLGKRARTGSAGPPPSAASSSLLRPSALPYTAPRQLSPPYLPPTLPHPPVAPGPQAAAGDESPETRMDTIARQVRWVFNIL